MPMDDYSPHQQKLIKRYYNNQEAIQTQRLGELVTELYLAEGKKRQKLWQTAASALEKLEVPKPVIERLVAKDDAAELAKVVKELFGRD